LFDSVDPIDPVELVDERQKEREKEKEKEKKRETAVFFR
jgi:hypothetical protein